MAAKDYTGMRFGALVALSPHHSNGRRWFWTVQCNCGTKKIIRMDKLVRGKIKSCGCAQHSHANHPLRGPDTTGRRKWFDGAVKSSTYKTWGAMLERCTNPKSQAWKYYGATGISVCERWHSFGNFLADMGERPPGLTLDRWPNPSGNYEPGNCRWATWKEQAQNKRPWGTVAAKKFPEKRK